MSNPRLGAEIGAWDASYRNAGGSRLWPQEPTVTGLNLAAWRESGVHVVLDAGCGDGKNLTHLAREGFFAVGADASELALVKCRHYVNDQGLRGSCLLLAPTLLDQLPLFDKTIDAAVCVDVLGHLEDPQPVLGELRRVIRDGGLLYASTFDIDDACRTGPRLRPGAGLGEFWYHATGRADVEYYYRFRDEAATRELFQASGMQLESLVAHSWEEPPHVGYREEAHRHASWFAILRNK